MNQGTPSTATQALASSVFVCPTHGIVAGRRFSRCGRCEKKPYDLGDPDDLSMMRNLRKVAKSRRMNVARVFGFPFALLFLSFFLGGFLLFLTVVPLGEAFSRGVETILRRLQPATLREVDKRVL